MYAESTATRINFGYFVQKRDQFDGEKKKIWSQGTRKQTDVERQAIERSPALLLQLAPSQTTRQA